MKRRAFVGGSLAAAQACTLTAAFGQVGTPRAGPAHRVGMLTEVVNARLRQNFVAGLAQAGFLEGRDVSYHFLSSDGDEARLAGHARTLIDLDPSVLVAPSPRAAMALRDATRAVPLVISSTDPVAAGLVKSLARPESNVTGLVIPHIDLVAKRVEMLHTLAPRLRRLHVLWNPRAHDGGAGRSRDRSSKATGHDRAVSWRIR